jgi:murein DD-endopeptidase MepM/ murein hydrolase activator NlpD
VRIDSGTEIVTVAHLRPGSVAVAVGEQVRAGQFLGAVGSSGNSFAPHLHLQAERDGVGLDLRFAGVADSAPDSSGNTSMVPAPMTSRDAYRIRSIRIRSAPRAISSGPSVDELRQPS